MATRVSLDESRGSLLNTAMQRSPHVQVQVDLSRIRANVERIRKQTGVDVLAVVKADAYGLGVREVAIAIRNLVDGFCVLSLREAVESDLHELTGKPILAMGLPDSEDVELYRMHHVRPAVITEQQARTLRAAGPVLALDTGMQRFTCPPEQADAVLKAGGIKEAFTHATRIEHVELLTQQLGGRGLRLHAAATSLLDEPTAWLAAVRPGLALYQDAVRVTTPLIEARDNVGPAGYGGFVVRRHGVILAGYSNGLRTGVVLINGQRRRIIEVGMQSAYIELEPTDRAGDQVVMLSNELPLEDVAGAMDVGVREALIRMVGLGTIQYVNS
jgi:alanine racemase